MRLRVPARVGGSAGRCCPRRVRSGRGRRFGLARTRPLSPFRLGMSAIVCDDAPARLHPSMTRFK